MTAQAPRNMIFNGDCIDVMQAFDTGSIDFILTDPPYVTRYRDRQGRSVANDDNGRWLKPAFAEMHRVLKDGGFAVSFYGWNKVDLFTEAWRAAGFRIVGHLVFRKRYASSSRFLRYEHEQAYLLAKGAARLPARVIPDVIDFPYSGNLFRQPAPSDAEAGGGAASAHRGVHPAGRTGAGPVQRIGIDAGGGAGARPRLDRDRTDNGHYHTATRRLADANRRAAA